MPDPEITDPPEGFEERDAAAPGEPPPELTPTGRPRRKYGPRKAKEKTATPAMTTELAAQSWAGLWALLRLVTWLVGRFFVQPGETAELAPLTKEEADADAVALAPLFGASPVLSRILSFVGAPIIMLQRVKEKITVRKPDAAKDTKAA